jgi:hypothetical protein
MRFSCCWTLNLWPAALWNHVGWWVGVLFEDVVSCWNYLAIVIDKWMITEHWCKDIDRGKKEYSEKNLSQCHIVCHKSHTDRLGHAPACGIMFLVLLPNIFYFLFAVPYKIELLIWKTADKIQYYLPLLLSTINVTSSHTHTSLYMVSSLLPPLMIHQQHSSGIISVSTK